MEQLEKEIAILEERIRIALIHRKKPHNENMNYAVIYNTYSELALLYAMLQQHREDMRKD